jgi:hypothetical protein
MWEDRTGTMIYDELPFNAEATRSPHASRRWSLVVDAAVGPLVHHLCRDKVPSRGTGRAAARGAKAPTPSRCVPRIFTPLVLLAEARGPIEQTAPFGQRRPIRDGVALTAPRQMPRFRYGAA